MKCAVVALLTAVMMMSVWLHAGAHRPLVNKPSHATTLPMTDTLPLLPPTPQPQAKHNANLTAILTLDGPFHTFLGYLQQTKLVEAFQSQAYLTDQGITIFVPVDRAFAAVKPPGLSNLSVPQMKNLMMYHSLPKHYELADFEQLSKTSPVTTLAGGLYTVNVTYDAGTVHVHSTWALAQIVGSVSVDAPMAIYELDRVLLPDTLFRTQPPVEDADVLAAPPPSKEDSSEPDPVVTGQYGSPGVADAPVSACGDDDGRLAGYAAATALGAIITLVGL